MKTSPTNTSTAGMRITHYGKPLTVFFYQYGVRYKGDREVFTDNLTTGTSLEDARAYLLSSLSGSGHDTDGSLPELAWVKKVSIAKAQDLLDNNCADKLRHDEVCEFVDR